MAPEQAASPHHVDHRSDLFSLGCVLYRLATGVPAFSGSSMMGILLQLQNHHPESPLSLDPLLPPTFSTLVMQLLEKNPDDRPGSARDVVNRIRKIESKLPPPPVVPGLSDTVSLHTGPVWSRPRHTNRNPGRRMS
jgi:serine/threonine protein kinase